MNVAYTGDWADGAPHGDGTAEWHPVRSGAVMAAEKKKAAEGGAPISPPVPQQSYSGQWVGGAPEGEGCFSWKDGSSYKGQWKGGERHGEGAWIPQPSNDTPKRPPPMSEDRIIAIVDLYGESFRPPQYLCMYVCMYGNALCGVVCPAPLRTGHVCLTPKLTVVDQRGLITNP